MPITELSPADPRLLATFWLLISLLVCGVSAWVTVWRRERQRQPWLDGNEGPRATWGLLPERLALLLAILWVGLNLAVKSTPADAANPPAISKAGLMLVVATSGGTTLLLAALLSGSGQQPVRHFGLQWQPLTKQLRDGWFGFKLAIVPMAVTVALSAPLRNRETQNPLLRVLSDHPDPATVALIILVAIVIAPLSEEMIFRVILQGVLSNIVRARLAILAVAVYFSAIHGPVDGLALLPLALILGSVFHRTHSYITVVVIHSLFNATMLALSMLSSR